MSMTTTTTARMNRMAQYNEAAGTVSGTTLVSGVTMPKSPVSHAEVDDAATRATATDASTNSSAKGPAMILKPSGSLKKRRGWPSALQETPVWSASSRSRTSPRSSSSSKHSMEARPFEHVRTEYQYMVTSLHRQEGRVQALMAALATVQAQLQALPAPARAEARQLRKNLGLIRSKIADTEQQERMTLLGLGSLGAELQSHHRHFHLEQQQQQILACDVAQTSQPQAAQDLLPHSQPPPPPPTPYLVPYSDAMGGWGPAMHAATEGHPIPADMHWFVPPPFVVSPVTPGMVALTPTRLVSPPASPPGEYMSPMSPLAPVFEPGTPYRCVSRAVPTTEIAGAGAASVDAAQHMGVDLALANRDGPAPDVSLNKAMSPKPGVGWSEMPSGLLVDDDDSVAETRQSDSTRQRRCSHGAVQETTPKRHKRRSLPPVRLA